MSANWSRRVFSGSGTVFGSAFVAFLSSSCKEYEYEIRDAAAIYSRVEVSKQQVDSLKTLCQNYFLTNRLLLGGVSPSVWT